MKGFILMKKFEIILDSGADMPLTLRQKYDIYPEVFKGIIYNPDGSEMLRTDIDYQNISPEQYFAIIKKNAGKIKTSFTPVGEMVTIMDKIAKEGKDVLVITISSGISGTYGAAIEASELVKEDNPDVNIKIVDSLKYSSGIAILAIRASEMRSNGASLEEVEKHLNELRYLIHESGPMDDLMFLAKSGRLKGVKAFFGQMVGVRPLADFNYNGENEPIGTVKGKDKVDNICLTYMEQLIENPQDQIIFISHSNRHEKALKYQELIQKKFNPKAIYITNLSQSCGANVGPGLCAAFYIGKPITSDRKTQLDAFAYALKVN